jgi:hypothetical protein
MTTRGHEQQQVLTTPWAWTTLVLTGTRTKTTPGSELRQDVTQLRDLNTTPGSETTPGSAQRQDLHNTRSELCIPELEQRPGQGLTQHLDNIGAWTLNFLAGNIPGLEQRRTRGRQMYTRLATPKNRGKNQNPRLEQKNMSLLENTKQDWGRIVKGSGTF